ncbi:MAG: TIM barrel protein [Fuerstiella sp.]
MPAATKTHAATAKADPFQLNYAPHPGMFKASDGKDVIDQIKFAHEAGFRSWEFNGLPKEPIEVQQKVGDTLKQLEMTMGVFVAHANFDRPTFVHGSKTDQAEILADIKSAVAVAKRCGAKWMTVVPGSVDQQHAGSTDGDQAAKWNKYGGARLSEGYQTANAIQMLRRCAEILEAEDLVMVLEPLNEHTITSHEVAT